LNPAAHRLTAGRGGVRWGGIRRARTLIPVLIAVLLSVGAARAFAADPYVIYTANRDVNGAVILRTDPVTGSTLEISRNGPLGTLFQHPYDLAVEADGSLLVADMGVADQKDGSVIRVDPFTGRQSLVSSGDNFYDPAGIAIGPGGVLYVLDNLAGSNSGAVIRVDPKTGEQDVIASNFDPVALFDFPFGIAVQPDGGIVVVNRSLSGPLPELGCLIPTGAVFRLEPGTWDQVLISQLLSLSLPLGVAIDTDGSIVVANECGTPNGVGLVRVLSQVQQIPIAANGEDDFLRTPERVAVTPAGDYVVSDFSLGADEDGGIVKVARGSQAQSVVSSSSLFNHPLGIAAVANRPPTAALAVAPAIVAPGRQVRLDASGSRDPEGLRLVYEWDLDGNGTFEAGSGTTPTAMPKFGGNGVKIVRVRVDDPHGGQGIAARTIEVDGSRPVLTGLRTLTRVLGVPGRRHRSRRSTVARRTPPRSTTLGFRLSESATVTLALDRARAGRRPKGKACSRRAKRGRRCTAWSRVRMIRRSFSAGEHGITVRARGLRPGRYRAVLSATDRVGNKSPRRTLGLRVVRLPR
jgi:DNA-binding beta-propeller fold protein YncE